LRASATGVLAAAVAIAACGARSGLAIDDDAGPVERDAGRAPPPPRDAGRDGAVGPDAAPPFDAGVDGGLVEPPCRLEVVAEAEIFREAPGGSFDRPDVVARQGLWYLMST
jgi:hypothetical protein